MEMGPAKTCQLIGKSLLLPGLRGSLSFPGCGLLGIPPLPRQDACQRTPPCTFAHPKSRCDPEAYTSSWETPILCINGGPTDLRPHPHWVPLPPRAESGSHPRVYCLLLHGGAGVEVEACQWRPGLGAGLFPPSGQAPPSPEIVGQVRSSQRCVGKQCGSV